MDIVFVLLMLLISILVAGWILSLLSRRHVHIATSLTPDQVAAVCDGKFSRLGWRRVDGRGSLNFQRRGIAFRGATPPVLSIDIGTDDNGVTLVEMWLSKWTTQYGMVNHVEKVFWKRWTIPRAIREAEQAGSLPSGPAVPSQQLAQTVETGSDGRKAASDDAKVPLPDPGRPEDDRKQLAYSMFDACGLTVLSWGTLSLEQHVQMLLAAAPAFRNTEVSAGGAGSLPGHEGMWLGVDSPNGSLVAYFVTGGDQGQTVVEDILTPIQQLPAPMNWGISTKGASVATGVANIFASGRVVPLWELSPFSVQRPAEQEPVDVPPELADALTEMGWTNVGDNAFRNDHAVAGGGLQTMFFGSYNSDAFALMAPIGSSDNGAIPPRYRGRSFVRYPLEIIADMVMLCQHYPTTRQRPTPDAIAADARELAEYAYRQAEEAESFATTRRDPVAPEFPAHLADSAAEPTAAAYVPPPTQSAPPPQPAYAQQTYAEPPFVGGSRPTPAQRQSSRNPMVITAAIVAIVVVAAAVIFAVTRSDDRPKTTTAGGGSSLTSVSADEAEACSSAPELTSESAGFSNSGLTISTRISPSCSGGDLLTNRKLRITAVDAAGKDVASGIFDLASTPIAVGSDGASVDFTFPAGTYWRTAEAITGDLRLTAYKEGYDTTASSTVRSVSELIASGVGAPESGDIEAVAQSALADIAAADRAVIDATLLNVWQPQLSSKQPGLYADGITWTNAEIVREHIVFRQQYPNARLLWSGDWPVYSDQTWWITVSGISFNTGEQAIGWCADHGYDWEHCFAKVLSHTMRSSGTTLLQKH